MAKGKLAELKFDTDNISQEIGHPPGDFRQTLGQDGIALVVVPTQYILRVQLGTVVDFRLALRSTSSSADTLGRESRATSRFVRLFKKQDLCPFLRGHQSGHEAAPPGTDDDDIVNDRV